MILAFIIALILGFGIFFVLSRKYLAKARARLAETERLREEVNKEIEAKRKEAIVEAKEETYKLRTQLEREYRAKQLQLQKMERRLVQHEEGLTHRTELIEKREKSIVAKEQELNRVKGELAQLMAQRKAELERISRLSSEEAREMLLKTVEDEVRQQSVQLAKQLEEEARREADKKAKEIISTTIQRCAVEQVTESTVAVVPLPNDEMKGRIIGREGRNIRAFETLTGVDLIIDDTPEAVVLSSFDPVRRETARKALESLISDGRIHPGRIEETIEKAKREIEDEIREAGERVVLETGVTGLHPELIKKLGSLKFRTSYGQNVLQHSIEVCQLAAMMAAELKVNVPLVKRAGLLHDIGKSVDHKVEGPHAAIGVDLVKRYNESAEVANCIAAHHGEEEPQTVEAVLISAADALSASRPGVRRETLETYIKRLDKLETIADSFAGVEKAYAIQAGREIRVIVKPEALDDLAAYQLAKDIVKKIEENLEYPGQIKVTVVRETRAIEYAK